jgi:hypothetical protein
VSEIMETITATKIGVVTFDEIKAREFMRKIELENKDKVIRFVKQDGVWELLLDDDRHYVWIEPTPDVKQTIIHKVYVDRNINIDIMNEVVFEICRNCFLDLAWM